MTKPNQYFPESVPHPGETLAEKLEEMKITSKEFALQSGIPEITVQAVINGESLINPDLAILLDNATKIPAQYWMNHQKGFDENIESPSSGKPKDSKLSFT